MEWCEANGIDFVFSLAGSRPLSAKIEATADAVRTEHAVTGKAVVRGYAEARHKAKSWTRERTGQRFRGRLTVFAATIARDDQDLRMVVTLPLQLDMRDAYSR